MTAEAITHDLRSLSDPEVARHAQRFFKTGKGQYGEGDRFLGIRVPVLRSHLKRFRDTPLDEVAELLRSPYHEIRLFALLLLVAKYQKGTEEERTAVFTRYTANTRYINNWDLVDSSAPYIVGPYLEKRDKSLLYTYARSGSLWERRIAVMATFHFIRKGRFDVTFELADLLMSDREDLIHKAVGWMLREVGKRNTEAETAFLNARYKRMPRTMLRYAIEKFPMQQRKRYLAVRK